TIILFSPSSSNTTLHDGTHPASYRVRHHAGTPRRV
ncbi:unnamed protein product, partial [Prunus brigantina]